MNTFHALHLAQSLITGAAKLYAIGGEIFTVTALLWALNLLGNITRKVYQAGRAVGYVYFHYIKPTLAQIDWRHVATTIKDGIVAVAVMTYLAGKYTGQTMYKISDWLAQHWPTRPNTEPQTIAEIITQTETKVEACVTLNAVQLLRADGMSQRKIAATLGITRYQVRKALVIA